MRKQNESTSGKQIQQAQGKKRITAATTDKPKPGASACPVCKALGAASVGTSSAISIESMANQVGIWVPIEDKEKEPTLQRLQAFAELIERALLERLQADPRPAGGPAT